MEHIYLQGSEAVSNAASSMRGSAEQINRAATNIDGSLSQFQRFMDDWLQRLEAVLEKYDQKGG
jgi:hypothetical protein